MRIGISLNGEGRGHLTRISAIAQELQKRHEIIFWVPETRYSDLSKLFPDTTLNTIPAFELTVYKKKNIESEMNFNFKDNTKEAVYLLENKFISLTKKRAS